MRGACVRRGSTPPWCRGLLRNGALRRHDERQMPQQILSNYLAEIARNRATRAGAGEISYYGALTGALNAAGERLKPCVF
jgi:hypothetical protein